jgi:hypothetical protein
VRPILERIPKRGVYLNIGCPDQDTAEDTLRELHRIGGA